MKKFTGECFGGPYDGQELAHWTKTKALFEPMISAMYSRDTPVRAVKLGEYRLSDKGVWHWYKT